MRVLAAVLADAAWIGLHVARLLQRFLERRREEQCQRRIALQQVRLERLHGARRSRRVGRARDHAPGLRDGVDAALVVAGRTERRAIVYVSAAIPLAIPGVLFERGAQARGVPEPGAGEREVATLSRE